ncbi:MAG: hypothetical protein LAO55_21280 [Acidobacteriia bacterium]|nr:hypothetical protein [Terriglobia bacterium]
MSTSIRFKTALSALLAGALMLATPNVTFAQHRGGGGGSHASGSRGGSSGGRGFSGQRGGRGQSFSSRGSGRQSFSGQRGFSGGERGFRGGVERGRGGDRNRDVYRYRGGYRGSYGFGYYSTPYYGYGGYYPGYSYAPNYCNPNGYYDQWGNWYPDPRCSYDPYYGY